ncbi:ABC transporter permease [Streptomyces sp. FIT100]|uniref:ABC transporter permease n=1 Tax=Streptomyces sp. FIT100 TaxID=2837956 RepID=UPI0021C8ED98|nr:ABC transporter permease [Streptomyces sp. FIT100]UUN30914.1 ABC transporter permease [Streptomyces sp. FIT100]
MRRHSRLWAALALPALAWLGVFFLGAILLVLALSFGTTDPLGNPVFAVDPSSYRTLMEPVYARVLVRSLLYAGAATALCAVVAYPVAYSIARYGGRFKNVLIAAVVVPFFANYLVRMYGWSALLADEGPVMRVVGWLPFGPERMVSTAAAVVGGLAYGFVVFMILPVYAALERLDPAVIEAGRDLYGSRLATFVTVTVPATRHGVYAGAVLTFLPATGDFVSAQFLGGPEQLMIGNLVQEKFFAGQDWPLGAALTVLLMAVLVLCTVGYVRQGVRREVS